jgi:hypothetical protein
VAVSPDDGERPEPSAHPPARKRIAPDDAALTKAICLGDDPKMKVMIGAQLGKNRKARSSPSSRLTPMYLHGNRRICPSP